MKHTAEELRWALKASKSLDDNATLALTDLCRMTGAHRGELALTAMRFGLIVMHSCADMLVLSNLLTSIGKGEPFDGAEDKVREAF